MHDQNKIVICHTTLIFKFYTFILVIVCTKKIYLFNILVFMPNFISLICFSLHNTHGWLKKSMQIYKKKRNKISDITAVKIFDIMSSFCVMLEIKSCSMYRPTDRPDLFLLCATLFSIKSTAQKNIQKKMSCLEIRIFFTFYY